MARAGALFLLALGAASPAIAQAPEPLIDRLPGGNGTEWRDRLANWSRVPDELPRVVESVTVSRAAPRLAISSTFGWRRDPLRGGSRHHDGIDLPGPLGSNVFATGAGVVSFAGWASGYGNLVQIDHPGGLRTRYGHLSRILVSQGASVLHGERIGLMGSTGRSTGSHLHYEVRLAGAPVNPLGFIAGQSIPRYDVAWPTLRAVTPRWTGWRSADDFSTLPEATIR